MENNNDKPYLVTLSLVDGLGLIRLKLLLDFFGNGETIWEANEKVLMETGLPKLVINNLCQERENVDLVKYFAILGTKNIKVLTMFDKDYPENLKNTDDKSVVLYYKGES